MRDKADNVIIFKAASEGYEEHEGVRVCTDGNSVWADGTTLGTDDGISVRSTKEYVNADAFTDISIT